MLKDLQAAIRSFPPNVDRAVALLAALAITGTIGYIVIEGFSFLDAAYTTVVVLTTIGFGNTEPLDDAGRVFTILLAVVGIGAIFYTLLAVFQFLIEGEFGHILGVQRMKSQIQSLSGHQILCGYGRVGQEIAREFSERGVPFVVIDNNEDAIERARRRNIPLLVGDATTDDILREAGVERASCLLAASDSDSGNTFIALTAKALNPGLFVVARAAHPQSQPRMLRAGADRVFSPYVTAGRQMAISALQPTVVELIDTLATGREGERILAEIDASPDSGLAGQTIEQVLTGSKTIVVLGIRRADGQVIVGPPASEQLRAGDRVIVVGDDAELDTIQADHTHRKR
ncbi:MAG TPA: NAD-binding protein [Dehalococcoidia bacterium]|jgi:voltage-gated potassium channel|nr:NAD-binding protein [Dehalococcoidia bacterium]